MSTFLTTDFGDPQGVPYFLWDDPMTVAEFKARLSSGSQTEQARFMGKLLREARDTEVWKFVSPSEVWSKWPSVAPHLGRRRSFWEFLLGHWQREGLLGPR